MLNTENIYQELLPDLEKAEAERQSRKRKLMPWKIIVGVCVIVAVNYFFRYNLELADKLYLGLGVIVIIGIYGIIHMFVANGFILNFQDEIAPKIISNLGPDFVYQPDGKIPDNVIENTRLFSSFSDYYCEDLVQGHIDEKPIEFAEIMLEAWVQRGRGNKHRKLVFFGVFLSIELKAKFPSSFWMLPKISKNKHIIACYPQLEDVKGDIIQTGHDEFDEIFTLFSEDPGFVRGLLKEAILERITTLNKDLLTNDVISENIMLAFIGNKIYVAMTLNGELLEPRLSEKVNSKEFVMKQLLFLDGIYHVCRIMG